MSEVKTVLVVDDSRVSRLLARQYILNVHPNWIVEEASTGEEAIERITTLTPALILMDVNMPGMGGLNAAEKLRALCPSTPISLITANVQTATRLRAEELGVGFMAKPITGARIAHLLESLAV